MSDLPRAGEVLAFADEVEVAIEKIVAGGDGLGRVDGVPIFVPRSAPGDRLRVRVVQRRPDYGRGEIVEVLEPGSGRREPPCPYFDRCGGCDLQHLEDELQVRLKAEAVVETLERIGKLAPPPELAVVAGDMWGYRLRAQLRAERRDDRTLVGYFARGSHDLVPVDRCPILVEELEELVGVLPDVLGDDPPGRIDLLAGDEGTISSAPVIAIRPRGTAGAGDGPATEGRGPGSERSTDSRDRLLEDGVLPHGPVELSVGGETYELDAKCFFQAHRGLVGELVERAVGSWDGESAVDLYAGVGLFTVPLSRRYDRVVAVEGDVGSARYNRRNTRRAARGRERRPDVEVVGQAVESWISGLPADLDRVVVDPPRGGLARPVREALTERPPRRLTYVSCHPATLARDLRDLGERFHFESLCLLDLFPQSGHMEAVAQLAREG